jgi:hypothetical protein
MRQPQEQGAHELRPYYYIQHYTQTRRRHDRVLMTALAPAKTSLVPRSSCLSFHSLLQVSVS